MTIEIYQPGREKPITIEYPHLFEAVDAATNDSVLLKALIDSKGFLAFQGTTKFDYEKDREENRDIDGDGTIYNAGDVIQLVDGVIAVGS